MFDPEEHVTAETEVVNTEHTEIAYAEITTELVTIEYERSRPWQQYSSGHRERLKTREPISGERTIIVDEHAENEVERVENVLSEQGWDYVELGEERD